MKSKTIFLDLLISLFLFWSGCSDDKVSPQEDQTLNITETSASDCKNETKSAEDGSQYIELTAVNKNQLKVTFVNAVLNCCPGEIVASASIEDEILKVEFSESDPNCYCNCPYDLDCTIDDMENRKYNIEIYVGSDTPEVSFSFTYSTDLDLTYSISD